MTHRVGTTPIRFAVVAIAPLLLIMAACSTGESRTFALATLNDSGVTGTAVLTDLGGGSTRVVIEVDPAGHPAMPAHIHPGTCANLVPQPLHGLSTIIDGASETVVPASLVDLLAGELAINLHFSASDMGTYTACVDLN